MKKTSILLVLLLSSPAFGQYWENPNQKPSLFGMRINRTHPLGETVGYWLFSEGFASKVYDFSGNASHGTEQVDSVWQAGKYGPIRYFSGDDYINCGRNPVLEFGGSVEFTIIVRAVATNTGNRQWLVAKRCGQGSPYAGYTVGMRWDDFYVVLDDGPDTVTVGSSANCFSDNTWFTAAYVATGGIMNYYIDGVYLDNDDISDIDTVASSPTVDLVFCRDADVASNFLTGQIDYVMIFNRALTASEIAQVYREPFCMLEPSWDWVLYGGISAPVAGAPQVIFIN